MYLITRKDTGRKYIGKKRLVKKTSRKPLKGKKRKRISYSESDWRTYFGSNDELLRDVAETGEGNFAREVLVFCKTLSTASYIEGKLQTVLDVVVSEDWYNAWIMMKVRTSPAFRSDCPTGFSFLSCTSLSCEIDKLLSSCKSDRSS